jgi:hypothetical protein
MVTSAKNWKNKQVVGDIELTLPSGNTCLVRRLKPEAFLKTGLIPDSLSGMVNTAIKSKKGLPPDALKQIVADPKKIRQAMQMTDEVACYMVREPKLVMPPKCKHEMAGSRVCGEYFDTDDKRHEDDQHPDWHAFIEGDRDEDVLYADQVSEEDKQFIFQFGTGGTADVERFRKEFGGHVAGISNGQNVRGKGKRTTGNK